MGFWNFGLKNRRVSHSEEHGPGGAAHEKMVSSQPNQSQDDAHISSRASRRTSTQRMPGEKPRRLTKADRSPYKDSAVRPARRSATAPIPINGVTAPGRTDTFPTPPSNPFISPTEQLAQSDVYQHNPASQSSLGQDMFSAAQHPPTLKARRVSQDPSFPRRRLSKRKADDHAREHEIRAMTAPIPIPKRASHSGGPLRRDTKKIPGHLNHNLQRPASDVSLPIAESLNSSLDELPEHQHSFKVTAMDILSPRPTVRYTDNPRHRPSKASRPSQSSTKNGKRPAIPEEETKSSKRIDELADGLGASELRELMERDRKRKERKQRVDQERLERRLQRRADRQRQQEQMQSTVAGPSNQVDGPSMEQSQPAGLGISASTTQPPEQAGPVERSSAIPSELTEAPRTWLGDTSKEKVASEDPFTDEKAEGREPLETNLQPPDRSFLRNESPMDVQMSQGSILTASPPRSPAQRPRDRSSMSQMSGLHREYTPDIPEHRELSTSRRGSDQSGPQTSSWTIFFKRGGTRRRRTSDDRAKASAKTVAPPSEFSNTSRESFMRQGPPPSIPPRTFRKSSVPRRTQSKFREDLPDFPISPPDSRVQSPEAEGLAKDEFMNISPEATPQNPPHHAPSTDLGVHDEVTGFESPEIPPSAVMSQSLASVDSEGSWLSGRPAKRNSTPMGHHVRHSESSLQDKPQRLEEEEDLANDEYLNRLTPGPEPRHDSESPNRRASSAVLEAPGPDGDEPEVPAVPGSFLSDDDDEGETKWHGGVARQPTLIRQHDHIKSREGLLNDFTAGGEDESEGDEEDVITPESAPEQEATRSPVLLASRVDYGKGHHARHISAGSAKLLDVRRTSLDSNKRLSNLGIPTTPRIGENEVEEAPAKS